MKDQIKEYLSYVKRRIGKESLFGSGALYSLDLPLRFSGYALSAGLYFSNLFPWNLDTLFLAYSGLRLALCIPETMVVKRQEKEGRQIITPDLLSTSLGVSVKKPVAGPLIKGVGDVVKQIPVYYWIPEPYFSIHLSTELGLTIFRTGKDCLLVTKEYFNRRKTVQQK